MPRTPEERRQSHHKQERVDISNGVPSVQDLREGVSSIRSTREGMVEYIKKSWKLKIQIKQTNIN